ncbi:IS30 family transposase [Marinomonas mediterranea]|uniref:IS30 family transposase n=1 Tax=Marinomonas mediterranea TaxID=119864 RepID=UPI002349E01B|nr:IS30 family transposase [Marinomonas mediterranea]WCN09146.1 IS30 family transposase [Marinomonas mediterranea]WCN09148.1 IS30 family transposase [Marinomonas mediterranea]WCN09319.1 IS30 family transposase [Marinomonas mediterranea]
MNYQQLTEGKRYQISALLEQQMSVSDIANAIKCHKATVYRELKRNRQAKHYCPKEAHTLCLTRRKRSAKYRIPTKTINYIRTLIEFDWSPEQVSNVLRLCGVPVSHEWIYQYIHDDKRRKGILYRHLRQGHKRYRKGKRTKDEVIKNAVSIEERPDIVDTRKRFGDWEIDTVLGKSGTGSIVTLLERTTRFYLIKKVNSKSAVDVTQATIELLMPFKDHVHTITADNGREFAHHAKIAEALDTKVYFAHPYSSWERGANENSNGLLRQYVRKGTDLREIEDDMIHWAMTRINYRPRKCLGFKQPAVVFKEMCLAA